MKRVIKYLVIAITIMLPFMVNAKENVEVTNIELLSKSNTTEIVTDASYDGLNVNFDIKFGQLGDKVVYKLTIKNSDAKAYALEKGNLSNKTEYITYDVDYSKGNIINANDTKEATITITYASPVPDNMFVDGKYREDNNMSISLSNKVNNPKTSATGIVIIMVFVLLLIGTIMFAKGNKKVQVLTIILLTIVLPVATLAISKVVIKVNSKVEIINYDEFCVVDFSTNEIKNYRFQLGTTTTNYCKTDLGIASGFCKLAPKETKTIQSEETLPSVVFYGKNLLTCLMNQQGKESTKKAKQDPCFEQYGNEYRKISQDEPIQNKEKGCYRIDRVLDDEQ